MPITLKETPSNPTSTEQTKAIVKSVPLGNRVVIVLCSVIFAVQTLVPALSQDGQSAFDMCLRPSQPTPLSFLSHSFAHAGLLHLALNLTTLVLLGSAIERRFGTLVYLQLVVSLSILAGLVHTALFWIIKSTELIPKDWLLGECVVGISGVLFGFMSIEYMKSQTQKEKLLGFISLPAKYYPIAMLLFVQLLFPGASLLGHASGMAVGYAFGYFESVMLYPYLYSKLEQHEWIKKVPAFVESQQMPVSPGGTSRGAKFYQEPTSPNRNRL